MPQPRRLIAPLLGVAAFLMMAGATGSSPRAAGPARADAGVDPARNGAVWGWGPDRLGGYASDRILVKLAPGASLTIRPDGAVLVRADSGALDPQAAAELSAARPTSAEPAPRIAPRDPARAAAVGLDRWILVRVPTGTDTPALAQRLAAAGAAMGAIERAEVDGVGGIAADAPAPDDPLYPEQYALENTGQPVNGGSGVPGADIRARAAWHVSTGSSTTIIAILDSGVNPHVEFTGRLLAGWNVPQASADTTDGCSSHGTHVAGTAAAGSDDGIGVAGIDWNARILPVVVLNGCSGLTSWLGDGVIWAADHGAQVLNMSLQYSVDNSYLHDAILYAQAGGAIPVAASGNTGGNGVAWPARWEEVLAVGSIDSSNAPAGTTAVGPEVDVAAPGVQVLSTIDLADYGFKNGTSMACPQVAGTIALLRAAAPALPPATLRSYVEATCHDVSDPGFDNRTGWGRIDAGAAIRAARAAAGLGDLNGDGIVDGADLGALLGGWGGCGTPCPADLDDNGIVDGADLGILLGNWGGGS
ncbi:MAG: S8 family serine peptidase [Phycisphaerales bacterium]